jgi:transketolase
VDPELKKNLAKIANTIRGLSMDGVQKANSGHPGLPMGCAEIGAYLYGHFMKYNPKNPKWINRDRFILSAGHGSMLLYSCLHLAGFNLSIEDLKQFRQLHSKTPGHPEYGETDGVETTTGPLGQGVGYAVGQALALKLLGARFNTEKNEILNGKVVCLAGDGCMMEGVSSEVSSFAGHLNLNNLILIYDSNHICLDGPTSECFREDTKARYKAYGWEVYAIDGNDLEAIDQVLSSLREHQEHPAFIVAHTIIGKGSPHKAGTSKAHGAPLGPEEVAASKAALGLPQEDFYVPQAVRTFFEKRLAPDASFEQQWKNSFDIWSKANPDLLKDFENMKNETLPQDLEEKVKELHLKSPMAGRSASQEVINLLGDLLPQIYGGSADLSCSDLTMMKKFPIVAPGQFLGRNIKFGVREFGMATIASGLSETGFIFPYIGTFLTFSDYMRNAIRLASLMRLRVVYQFTHDSIFLGEDGPTHQPVEHYATLRAIPNLHVIRPADNHEVKMAWIAALKYSGPTALLLTRQNLPELTGTNLSYEEGMGRGAYIVKKEKGAPHFTLLATGSELSLALDVSNELEKIGKNVRVISMPCWELFEKQSDDYKDSILGGDLGVRVCIEAGVSQGWHKYIGMHGIAICQETFGASAPAGALAKEFGFTVEAVMERLLSHSSEKAKG